MCMQSLLDLHINYLISIVGNNSCHSSFLWWCCVHHTHVLRLHGAVHASSYGMQETRQYTRGMFMMPVYCERYIHTYIPLGYEFKDHLIFPAFSDYAIITCTTFITTSTMYMYIIMYIFHIFVTMSCYYVNWMKDIKCTNSDKEIYTGHSLYTCACSGSVHVHVCLLSLTFYSESMTKSAI